MLLYSSVQGKVHAVQTHTVQVSSSVFTSPHPALLMAIVATACHQPRIVVLQDVSVLTVIVEEAALDLWVSS